ncbi:hypothetical protein PQ472_07725 [Lacticaseibacillus pabuli]|uniref:Uncharacterized protein n=1 Tax=Lacticaseibacillus pabuli TaxID=3025672 RepID=A0ABY7WNN1_9LACO|nr:hypothetical protein [Lacticaseibacillus sp. KACC 23028]WDF81813.1 hypothetical protein PQ472_07725 [Lacticaseibacillus sp. KACC 23028]
MSEQYATNDKLDEIMTALRTHVRFKELVGTHLKAYVYPESDKKAPLFVTVVPMDPPAPEISGSDGLLGQRFYFQINVEGLDRHDVKEVAAIVRMTMSGLNFAQLDAGLDQFFSDTKRFVDARRYQGGSKIYDNQY